MAAHNPASFPPPPHSEPRPSRPGRRGAKRGGRGARLRRGARPAAPRGHGSGTGSRKPLERTGGPGVGGLGAWRRAAGTAPADKSPFSSAGGRGSPGAWFNLPRCRRAESRSGRPLGRLPGGPMPRCPTGAMDEGPVDLRTRPKAAGLPGAALPLRKRPLRAPSPEPAAPRCAAGPCATQEPLLGGSNGPTAPASRQGLARPEALYYQGECLSLVKVGLGATQGIGSPEARYIAQTQIQGVPESWGDRGRSQGLKTQIWGFCDSGGQALVPGYRHGRTGSSALGQRYMGVPGSWVPGA